METILQKSHSTIGFHLSNPGDKVTKKQWLQITKKTLKNTPPSLSKKIKKWLQKTNFCWFHVSLFLFFLVCFLSFPFFYFPVFYSCSFTNHFPSNCQKTAYVFVKWQWHLKTKMKWERRHRRCMAEYILKKMRLWKICMITCWWSLNCHQMLVVRRGCLVKKRRIIIELENIWRGVYSFPWSSIIKRGLTVWKNTVVINYTVWLSHHSRHIYLPKCGTKEDYYVSSKRNQPKAN